MRCMYVVLTRACCPWSSFHLQYNSVAEAMETVADVYVDVLLQLAGERGMEVLVHPVPPVLNETRQVVVPFNRLLQEHVREAGARPEAHGRLHWLDFADRLLTDDGASLRPELAFDGTHLAPVYLQHMQHALDTIA